MGNLFYRDVKYLFEIVITVWMFATSVVYPVEPVGGRLGTLLALNPMTPIIDAYRAVLLDGARARSRRSRRRRWSSSALFARRLAAVPPAEFEFAENI